MASVFAGLQIKARREAIVQLQRQTIVRTAQDVMRYTTTASQKESSARISAGDNAQELVYRAAIGRLNEFLRPKFGANAIQAAAGSNLAYSPDETAGRIVAQATDFFDSYRRNQTESDAAVRESFMETLREGISQGFDEARNVLGGLEVLNGDIASDIDRAQALVQIGLSEFERRLEGASDNSRRPTAQHQANVA